MIIVDGIRYRPEHAKRLGLVPDATATKGDPMNPDDPRSRVRTAARNPRTAGGVRTQARQPAPAPGPAVSTKEGTTSGDDPQSTS